MGGSSLREHPVGATIGPCNVAFVWAECLGSTWAAHLGAAAAVGFPKTAVNCHNCEQIVGLPVEGVFVSEGRRMGRRLYVLLRTCVDAASPCA